MNWTLEVVIVPVSDIDRSKAFYHNQLGFDVDHDTRISDEVRVVQFTPPGSGCSIVISKGIGGATMEPGSLQGVQLVVNDVRKARQELLDRGIEVGPVRNVGTNQDAKDDDDLNNVGFVFFSDPDGNGWAVQQITSRP